MIQFLNAFSGITFCQQIRFHLGVCFKLSILFRVQKKSPDTLKRIHCLFIPVFFLGPKEKNLQIIAA